MTSGSTVSASRSGILFVDKPMGLTSHGVVSRVRKLADTRKVGHAGTLDPMATGLLTLGINSSTRLLTFLVGLDKEYLATIRLGSMTDTDDAEGESVSLADPAVLLGITDEAIRAGVLPLTGEISQVPSTVSAIRVDGRHAYSLARAGETVVLKPREVTVSAFEVLAIRHTDESPTPFIDVDVRVECSSGTYIRALARDLGASLGAGGHLTALRRSRVGPFSLTDATPLENLDPDRDLIPAGAVAARLFPVLELDADSATDLSHGKRLSGLDLSGGPIAAIAPGGQLVGLVEVTDGIAKPIINFPPGEVNA
ncbi:tRNA pseudouridine(55) synthase TruB [Glaciihabitans sp. dw_435]|uniref:tRNA pseudouridine(55) synthase TruB n=1 Tax=Glaciihabitans sp. dw_435 TaxID=2720081 RepID=UPI0027DBA932|nr:tRNA pseudouridine(55) synthase TruB [Glaciihabitans sp. dw_435]